MVDVLSAVETGLNPVKDFIASIDLYTIIVVSELVYKFLG